MRSLHPAHVRFAIVLDNYSPHLYTTIDSRVGDWAEVNNVELAYVPFYGSWLNRIEAQFTALRCFALDGTDDPEPPGTGQHDPAAASTGETGRSPSPAPQGHQTSRHQKAKVA